MIKVEIIVNNTMSIVNLSKLTAGLVGIRLSSTSHLDRCIKIEQIMNV